MTAITSNRKRKGTGMTKVQFGLMVPGDALEKARRHHYLEDVNRLLNAVKGAYASAWFIDHLQFQDGDVLEGWTALTYLAALHPELQWGHAVLCQSFRNPALVAKMAATLQFLSGGRFILGIGAGWHEAEHLAYGYSFPKASTRVEQLDEALQIMRALWTQESATFMGKHYQIREAWCEPKPDPMPPIVVGAFKPRMLRVAARHADWWNVSSTGIVDYRTCVREFERACDDIGRDPEAVRRSWCGGCACMPTAREVAKIVEARPQLQLGEDFVGTPQQLFEQMQPFVELGVDYFMLDCSGFPDLTTATLLMNEVLPALNRQ
jgi:alkanesulfonate monooxygenase SsuD/methylene tetrahydromethanopterin reductase-like flavin-dependent oxidoreductase (luciferase family)